MRARVSAAIALVGASSCAAPALPQSSEVHRSQHHDFRVVTVVTGLEHPWGMAFLPDGSILVTERPGRLRVVRAGVLDPAPVEGVPEVYARGQGGLLDVALHPDFANNRFVYLSYSKPGPRGATTAVIRGRFDGRRLSELREIFEARAWRSGGLHFGSRLAFDKDGYLFITVGERGQMEAAQDLSNHQGTHIRLHDDGRVPADNPFVGIAGALPEIYAYGNRNAQGLVVDPRTNVIWSVEHGARGGDELNRIEAGRNYGWPVITHGVNYSGRPISDRTHQEGMEQPLHYWVPSIATSGLALYTADPFARWRGDFFVGGLAGSQLARLRFDGDHRTEHEILLRGLGARIRDVRVGPDGFLYLLVDSGDAPMLRLEPAAAA